MRVVKAMTLDMTWLAQEMNLVGLLPDNTHKDVTNPRATLSEDMKATSMVSKLETLVEIEPKNLKKFVEILKKNPRLYESIINDLSPQGKRNKNTMITVEPCLFEVLEVQ